MLKKNLLLLYCTLFLLSCNKKNQTPQWEKSESLNYSIITEDLDVGLPLQLMNIGDKLFISDFHGENLIKIYSTTSFQKITEIAHKGEGPEEFIPPVQMYAINDNTLAVYNKSTGQFKEIHFSNTAGTQPTVINKFKADPNCNNLVPIDNNEYLSTGFFEENRFALLDSTGKIKKHIGQYPNFGEDEKRIPNAVKTMFHSSQFHKNDLLKKIAVVTFHTISIFDNNPEKIVEAKNILLAPYKYTFTQGTILSATRSPETVIGAVSSFSNNDFIYLLFNPNIIANPEKLNSEIWIYDWNGNPVKKVMANLTLTTICVIDNEIYGITNKPDPTLVKVAS